jgi:hypothetical protein
MKWTPEPSLQWIVVLAHSSVGAHLLHQLSRRFSDQTATMRAARDGSRTVAPLVDGYLYH